MSEAIPTIGRAGRGSHATRARESGMHPGYWYPAAFVSELDASKQGIVGTRFQGQDIVVFRGGDGRVGALEDRCAHRHIPLRHGSVEGCNLVCLYHGWTYDRAGRLVGTKHDDFGRKLPKLGVRAYPVRERYGVIWIFPGDPADADATPLPEIPHAEGPDRWASIHFAYTWNAHHSMVIDNLCNLTHLWVHGNWVPYDVTTLSRWSLDGERLTLSWHHTLRNDLLTRLTSRRFRTRPDALESTTDMVYDYPYQSALSNHRVRSCNFMLPMDTDRTKVFTVQFWEGPRLPWIGTPLPAALTQRLMMPLVKPITREIFRQDGFTVEEEQRVWPANRDRPLPEPNPVVRGFNQLAVGRWDAHLAGAPGGAAPGLTKRI